MSRQLAELETTVQMLIAEHEKLLKQLDTQQEAMKRLDARAMEDAAGLAESTRLRIVNLESRRKTLTTYLALSLRLDAGATLGRLAEALPPAHAGAKKRLIAMRQQLRELIGQVSTRSQVAGKLATGVLGHLNTVVRLLSGAVEQAGLYTKQGTPRVSSRIGMLEAVG